MVPLFPHLVRMRQCPRRTLLPFRGRMCWRRVAYDIAFARRSSPLGSLPAVPRGCLDLTPLPWSLSSLRLALSTLVPQLKRGAC
jgi:hypothetical protein